MGTQWNRLNEAVLHVPTILYFEQKLEKSHLDNKCFEKTGLRDFPPGQTQTSLEGDRNR